MQNGDLERQFTEDSITTAAEPARLAATESVRTKSTTEFNSDAAKETASVVAGSTLIPSGNFRLRSRIGSFWQRLRDKRREAAAVVVLIVITIVWLDTGSSKTGTTSYAADPLDGYEAVLSDFEPVGDSQPRCESADPFESSSGNAFGSGLSAAQSEDSASTNRPSAAFGGSTPEPTARDADDARAFNAFENNTSTGDGSDQQRPRKVKFVGRIKPAN